MTEAQDKGELEYGSIMLNGEDWRLRKFDAGMGEIEYRIFRNEKFFAMFDNRQDADIVMIAMTCPTKKSDTVLEPIGMNSTDILLLAHDEWKRREERKHNHPEEHWVPGFINGFLTDKKWGKEYVKKLREQEKGGNR